jgi:hypothetical protein
MIPVLTPLTAHSAAQVTGVYKLYMKKSKKAALSIAEMIVDRNHHPAAECHCANLADEVRVSRESYHHARHHPHL